MKQIKFLLLPQLQWQVTSGQWPVILLLFFLATIHYPLVTAFPAELPPRSPGCGAEGLVFDTDYSGSFPETCTDNSSSVGGGVSWEAEGGKEVSDKVSTIADTSANGGNYIHVDSASTRDNAVVEFKFTPPATGNHYVQVMHRNSSPVPFWTRIDSALRVGPITFFLGVLPATEGQWQCHFVDVGSWANFSAGTQGAKRAFNIPTTNPTVLRTQFRGTVDIDFLHLNSDQNAPCNPPGGGPPTPADVTWLEYPNGATFTFDGLPDEDQWQNAPENPAAASDTTNNTVLKDRSLWNDADNRFCKFIEYTDAILIKASPTTTNDDDAVSDNDRIIVVISKEGLDNDESAKIEIDYGCNSHWDADFSPKFDKTRNLNILKGCSSSGTTRRIEFCADFPWNAVPNNTNRTNQQESDLDGTGATKRILFGSTINNVTHTGTLKLDSTDVDPPPQDNTDPTFTGTSETNITSNSATLCVNGVDDNSGGNLRVKARYGTATGVYTKESAEITVAAGSSACVSVAKSGDPTLTASTNYFWVADVCDPVNNCIITSPEDTFTTIAPPGNTFYISPGGSDTTGDGTSGNPWKTVTKGLMNGSVKRIQPGDALILKSSGTPYTESTTELPFINCANCGSGGNAKCGTASQRITIKAETERGAHLDSDGNWAAKGNSSAAFRMEGCSYWNVEGFYGSSEDSQSGNSESVFHFLSVSNVNIKRNLASKPNRYFNTQGIYVGSSNNVLLEENEVYDFHRWGIEAYQSDRITFRRNYTHSRDRADVCLAIGSQCCTTVGCTATCNKAACSINTQTGDFGMGGYPTANTTNILVENSIAEKSGGGYQLGLNPSSGEGKCLGCIALNGAKSGHQAVSQKCNNQSHNIIYENFLSWNNSSNGAQNRGVNGYFLRNSTIYANNDHGVMLDEHATEDNDPCTNPQLNVQSTIESTLLVNNNRGVSVTEQDFWRVEWSNFSGNNSQVGGSQWTGESISDNAGNVRNSTALTPTGIGTTGSNCLVYVPATSNMKGAGKDGSDIGANIVYRYQDGVLQDGSGGTTATKLWDQSTGEFPCGEVVTGVNSDCATSCCGVHTRLRVGGSCPIP